MDDDIFEITQYGLFPIKKNWLLWITNKNNHMENECC